MAKNDNIPESTAVLLMTFTNETKPPAALKFTLRATADGETELDLLQRAKELNAAVEADEGLPGFKWREHEYARFGGKGKGAKRSPKIEGGNFMLTAVMRRETPNSKDANKVNQFFRAFGEQNGQKVFAECYMGTADWTPDDAVAANFGLFDNFGKYKLDEEKPWPEGNPVTVYVQYNEQYFNYSITSFANSTVAPPELPIDEAPPF